jgi:integrase
MQSHNVPTRPKSQPKTQAEWSKIAHCTGLYRYNANGSYHARVWHGGKLHWKSLQTTDLAFAKRKLHDFRQRLQRTDHRYGRVSLVEWLERHFFPGLKGTPETLKDKWRIIERIKTRWLEARSQPMADLRRSQVLAFLNQEFGSWSDSYWNSALSLVRASFEAAVADHVVSESPCAGLKYRSRQKSIRLTPSFEQFNAIVTSVRGQVFNRDSRDSGDFLEAMGLLGLGQAELSNLRREHIDLESGRIMVYRQKTSQGFWIPIFPQARSLVERLCTGKKPSERVLNIKEARKALANACQRLGFAHYTQRSLRRMFITRCLELGVDVKTVALWQGHRDSGVLILQTYSHVRPEHSTRMAARITVEQPSNVVPLPVEKEA